MAPQNNKIPVRPIVIRLAIAIGGLLALSIAGGNFFISQQEKNIEGEINALARQFAKTDFNQTALTLRNLSAQLGIALYSPTDGEIDTAKVVVAEADLQKWDEIAPILNQYLDQQLTNLTNEIAAPPPELQQYLTENVAILNAIRNVVLTQGRPTWWRDISLLVKGDWTTPLPSYLGVVNLQRVLALEALQKQRQGQTQVALQTLEVSWQISQSFQDDPYLIGQLVNLIVERHLIGTLRKVDNLPFDWVQRLSQHDYRSALLKSIELEMTALSFNSLRNLDLSHAFEVQEIGESGPEKARKGWPNPFNLLAKPYFRLSAIDTYQATKKSIDRLKAQEQDACRSHTDTEEFVPKVAFWNILGQIAGPNFANPIVKAEQAMLDRELTEKIVLVKTMAAEQGQWPAALPLLDSKACPGVKWVYQIADDDTMSFSLATEPVWAAERLTQNQGLPLTYRAHKVPPRFSVPIATPKIDLWEETAAVLRESGIDYGQLINSSLAGNEGSFQRLVALRHHTDAASALGFGVLLQQIALTVEDEVFAAWISDLNPQSRQDLHRFLEAGFDYGNNNYNLEDFAKVLPLTYQLTQGN